MTSELLRSVYLEIRDIYQLLNKQSRKIFEDFDITVPQLHVLKILFTREQEDRQVTITDLIHTIDCSPSAMSSMIQRLERPGWVTATRGIEDRREVIVRITEKGKEVLFPMDSTASRFLEENYGHLQPERLRALHELLIELKNDLK